MNFVCTSNSVIILRYDMVLGSIHKFKKMKLVR